MPSKRRALTACVLDTRIYALGGYDGSSWLNTVESFESRTGEWRAEVRATYTSSFSPHTLVD